MTGVSDSGRRRLNVEATLAAVEKLDSDRKYRNASGLFYIEGVRNFVQAVDNDFDISAILFSEKLLIAPVARKLVCRARRAGVNTKLVVGSWWLTLD